MEPHYNSARVFTSRAVWRWPRTALCIDVSPSLARKSMWAPPSTRTRMASPPPGSHCTASDRGVSDRHTHNENRIKFLISCRMDLFLSRTLKVILFGGGCGQIVCSKGGCWDTLWGNFQQYIPTIYSFIVQHFRPCFKVIFLKKQQLSRAVNRQIKLWNLFVCQANHVSTQTSWFQVHSGKSADSS